MKALAEKPTTTPTPTKETLEHHELKEHQQHQAHTH
jgi:hypothetical protein